MPYPYKRSASSKIDYSVSFSISNGESFRGLPEKYTPLLLNKISDTLVNDLSVEKKKWAAFSDLKELAAKSSDPANDIDLLNQLTENDDQPKKQTEKDYEKEFPSHLLNRLLKDGRLTRLNGEAFMKPEDEVTTEVRHDFLDALKNGDVLLFPATEKNAPGPSRLMISKDLDRLHCSTPMSKEELADEYKKLREDPNVTAKEKAALEGAEKRVQKKLLLEKLKADPTFLNSAEVYVINEHERDIGLKTGAGAKMQYDYSLKKLDTGMLQGGRGLHSLLTSTDPDDPYNISFDQDGKASLLIRSGDEMTVLTVENDNKNKQAVFAEASPIENANDFYEAVVGDGKNRYEEPSRLDKFFDSIAQFLRNIFNISPTAKERKEQQKADAIAETERVYSGVRSLLNRDKEKTEEKTEVKTAEKKADNPAHELDKLRERLTPESLGASAEDPKYTAFVNKLSALAAENKSVRDMAFRMSDPNANTMKPLYDSFDPKNNKLKEYFEESIKNEKEKESPVFRKTEQAKTVSAEKGFDKN